MRKPQSLLLLTTSVVLLSFLSACSSSTSANGPAPDTISLSLTPSFNTLKTDGTVNTVLAIASRSAGSTTPITLAATNVPAGVTVNITQPGTGSFGTLFMSSSVTATPGVYTITITASDGTATSTATMSTTLFAVDALTITASSPTLIARQDATPASTPITLTRSFGNTNSVTVTASNLPTGLLATYTQPGTGTTGTVTFTSNAAAPPAAGTYTVTLTAADGTATATTTVSVTVAVVLKVSPTTDTSIGLSGQLQQYMSTGFQPSTYNNSFFTNFPSTTTLSALNSLHVRLQPVVGAIPWVANSSPAAASDWSFTALDKTVQPVLGIDDKSPIFQIAKAPGFLDDANGHFIYNSANLALLTTYAQNLVRYYNTGGFTVGSTHFQSASSTPIKWWAIFNEPNLNNITATQYVSMYNTLVPAMLAVDPTLKFVGLELSDYSNQPQAYLPTMVASAANGGINAPMNAIATHFYGTCKQTTTDSSLFKGVATFASDVKYFKSELATRSDLAGIPIWVTENNVNSDYPLTTGYSSCTPTILYTLDQRGSSTFFTAYRPLTFSLLGKAGNQSLYHFLYEGSAAYGEVSSSNNATTLAYWTDYWLQRIFPWDGTSTGATLLKTTTTEPTASAATEIMATLNANGTVSLMVTNYATTASTDNNGAGAARMVYVDISALGTFTSITEVDLNASTPITTGPSSNAVTPVTTIPLTFTGYGTSFFTLHP